MSDVPDQAGMQAVILAGGKGRRLAPYTTVLPKPLMPVGDRPVLEILVDQLARSGVSEIIMAVGHLSHLIEAYFGNGDRHGVEISYSKEESALGTAGPLGELLPRLRDVFIVMNGDLLTTLNFVKLHDAHLANRADATIAIYERKQEIDFGVIEYDEQFRLTGYIEKPSYNFHVSMGINVLVRSVVEQFIAPSQYLDIPDLMKLLSQQGRRVFCYQESCEWLDIGRVDDYENAQRLFANPSQ